MEEMYDWEPCASEIWKFQLAVRTPELLRDVIQWLAWRHELGGLAFGRAGIIGDTGANHPRGISCICISMGNFGRSPQASGRLTICKKNVQFLFDLQAHKFYFSWKFYYKIFSRVKGRSNFTSLLGSVSLGIKIRSPWQGTTCISRRDRLCEWPHILSLVPLLSLECNVINPLIER